MKTSKVFLNISAVVCYLYGAVYIFSLVFIPIGIYCFITAKRFATKADNLNDLYSIDRNVFRNYVIFSSIFCFPFGLLSIIPYLILGSNNVKVQSENVANQKYGDNDSEKQSVAGDDKISDKSSESETIVQAEVHNETEAEKLEKFNKLKNFREKGLITDDELEMAREQLFGKKEDIK